jgi:hypothetical protein
MRSFTTTAIVFGLFAITALGDNCKPQLQYCGSTLLDVGATPPLTPLTRHAEPFAGDYKDQIEQALRDSNSGIVDATNARFVCLGGDAGLIGFIEYCSDGCVDHGSGNSDECK